MTLYEAVKNTLEYAAKGQLSLEVFGNLLGGRLKEVLVASGEARVVITYPGWELILSEMGGHVTANLRSVGTSSLEVRVADYPGDWHTAFARVVHTALEAMEVKA